MGAMQWAPCNGRHAMGAMQWQIYFMDDGMKKDLSHGIVYLLTGQCANASESFGEKAWAPLAGSGDILRQKRLPVFSLQNKFQ